MSKANDVSGAALECMGGHPIFPPRSSSSVCGSFLQTSGHLSSLSATRYVNRCRRSDDRVGRVGRTATDAMSQAMADPRITEYRQRPLALCLLFEIELGSAHVTLHQPNFGNFGVIWHSFCF